MTVPYILVADDDPGVISAVQMLLRAEGMNTATATNPQSLLETVAEEPVDIALIDLNYQLDTTSGDEGLTLISQLKDAHPDLTIIVMTGWATVEIAVEAMKRGAKDFIQKPWENERLLTVIYTQLQLLQSEKGRQRLLQENSLLRRQLPDSVDAGLIAESPAMIQLLDQIHQLAPTEVNILLRGDNGTGKSMMAKYIHKHSLRSEQSFITVNMGAIPDSLFESEMFGHVKGAFTDASSDRIGRFELAEGGTLFLDEISNIPPTQQAKLLRVLEERNYEKVGSARTQLTDARIISATNADLSKSIAAGDFRSDLLYRLNTVELVVPPLSARPQDVLPLAQHFVMLYAQQYGLERFEFDRSASQALQAYSWPGNVRELRHVVERALLIESTEVIGIDSLGLDAGLRTEHPLTTSGDTKEGTILANATLSMEDLEREAIKNRLKHFQGRISETARSFKLSRSAFYRRLQKYDL